MQLQEISNEFPSRFRRRRHPVITASVCPVSPRTSLRHAASEPPRKLSNDERKEYVALNETVDAVSGGKQPAPADVKLKFQNHFLKSNENVYVPYIVEVSGGKFSSFPVTMYIRAAQKGAAPVTGQGH